MNHTVLTGKLNFWVWVETVWNVDLDDLYCFDGYMCGCMGVSNRDLMNDCARKLRCKLEI